MTITELQQGRVYFAQKLCSIGNGIGDVDSIGDYSSSAVFRKFTPAAGTSYVVNRLTVCIADKTNFSVDTFGGVLALTNGIKVEFTVGGVTTELTLNARPISNQDLFFLFQDVSMLSLASSEELVVATIRLGQKFSFNDESKITLNDNFTGLDKHAYAVSGFRV